MLPFQLSASCSGVVCCRLSPLQKSEVMTMIMTVIVIIIMIMSEVIKLIKSSPGRPVTAAIGDGGNDVSMIRVMTKMMMKVIVIMMMIIIMMKMM